MTIFLFSYLKVHALGTLPERPRVSDGADRTFWQAMKVMVSVTSKFLKATLFHMLPSVDRCINWLGINLFSSMKKQEVKINFRPFSLMQMERAFVYRRIQFFLLFISSVPQYYSLLLYGTLQRENKFLWFFPHGCVCYLKLVCAVLIGIVL